MHVYLKCFFLYIYSPKIHISTYKASYQKYIGKYQQMIYTHLIILRYIYLVKSSYDLCLSLCFLSIHLCEPPVLFLSIYASVSNYVSISWSIYQAESMGSTPLMQKTQTIIDSNGILEKYKERGTNKIICTQRAAQREEGSLK